MVIQTSDKNNFHHEISSKNIKQRFSKDTKADRLKKRKEKIPLSFIITIVLFFFSFFLFFSL